MSEKNLKIAVILSAYDKMTAVIGSAVAKSQAKMQALKKTADNIAEKSLLFGAYSGVAGTGIAAALMGPIKAASEMQKMQIALKTSFQGNELAAQSAFSSINNFAARTPYELSEVMSSFIKLKNMGLDPSEKALTAYGNTASAMGKELNQMIEAVADAATGEFERLKEFGIRASSQGDKVKFTFQGVTTTVAKNSKDIEKYLMSIGNTKFAGGISAQSKTISGQFSTLQDNVKMTSATLGATLIPLLNRIFDKIGPILTRVHEWVNKNQKLASTVMIIIGSASVLSLTISALSFTFGGAAKAVSFFSTSGIFSAATMNALNFQLFRLRFTLIYSLWPSINKAGASFLRFGASAIKAGISLATTVWSGIVAATTAVWSFTAALLANPITWIVIAIVALAGTVYLLIKNWDKVKAFFIKLWPSIKQAFLNGLMWIKKILWDYQPAVLIYNNWSKITHFFSTLWDNIKKIFFKGIIWFALLHVKFYNAGKNIVKSIWEGIKSFANKPVEAIQNIVKKIRDFLPFSPAKVGPLRDIHRIKLIETIAGSIKAKPMLDAMNGTMAQVRSSIYGNSPKLALNGGGSNATNFNVTINLSGSATEKDANLVSKELNQWFDRRMREYQSNKARTSY